MAFEEGILTERPNEAGNHIEPFVIKSLRMVGLKADKPVSKKPAETRMGKGKGDVSHWVAVVLPGRILFEVAGVSENLSVEALRRAASKIPFKTKIVRRYLSRVE